MNIDELIVRYLQNETSVDENQQLLTWIKSDIANKSHFEALVQTWHESGTHSKRFDVSKAYHSFKQQVESKNSSTKLVEMKPNLRLFKRAMQVAAMVAVVAVGSYVVFYPQSEIQQINIANTSTDTKLVNLPDGSTVYLNAGAKISYSANFESKTRQIALSGEAFFDVVHNDTKPFVVQTHQGAVLVLGTSFSVIDDSIFRKTQVIVETGKVRLSDGSLEKYVDLLPGQSGFYSVQSNTLSKSENTDLNYASWHTGRLLFKNSELRDVVSCLQRHYKTHIELQNGKAASCKFTARFDHEPIDNVFKMLELTFSVRVNKTENGYIISGEGC